jgi:hypothetical protein
VTIKVFKLMLEFAAHRKAQEERILLLKHALEAKMGFDPTNSHYGVDDNRAIITSEPAQPPPPASSVQPNAAVSADNTVNGTTAAATENGADEGMYL